MSHNMEVYIIPTLQRAIFLSLLVSILAACQTAGGPSESSTNTTPLASPTPEPSVSATGTTTATPPPTRLPASTPTVKPTLPSTTTPVANAQGYPTIIDGRRHAMVRVSAGTFIMGVTEEQFEQLCALTIGVGCGSWGTAERFPAHPVTLTSNYWMDIYEVTNAQYLACQSAGICQPPEFQMSVTRGEYYSNPQFDSYPVLTAWSDAEVFCRDWRGGRLPSEAEWEYAARGTDGRLWPWGNTVPSANLLNYDVPGAELEGDTVEVGSYPLGVSPFGLYDMAGNVGEWVADRAGNYTDAPQVDPVGPDVGSGRIKRGGAFDYSSIDNSSIARIRGYRASVRTGIRCVRDTSQ